MAKPLPDRAHPDHLRKQAIELLRDFEARKPHSADRIAENFLKRSGQTGARIFDQAFTHQDALLVIAREYGFKSWPVLKEHLDATRFEEDKATFIDAVNVASATAVKKLLAGNRKLREQIDAPWFNFGGTALIRAAAQENRQLVDVLLEAGADINLGSDWEAGSFRPIHSTKGDTARHLIERGAEVDVHAAAQLGSIDRLNELLEADPNLIRRRGPDGQYPLHFAASKDVAAFLLDRGADLEGRCLDHNSLATQWMVVERPEVCRYLLEHGSRPDIFLAIGLNDAEILEEVVAADPDSLKAHVTHTLEKPTAGYGGGDIYAFGGNLCTGVNGSTLHACVCLERTDLANRLVLMGVEVDVRGAYDDCTPLHWAAWMNKPKIAGVLIENGADLEALTGEIHRNTPMGWACVAGAVEMVHLLLASGAKHEGGHLSTALSGEAGNLRKYCNPPLKNYRKIINILAEY